MLSSRLHYSECIPAISWPTNTQAQETDLTLRKLILIPNQFTSTVNMRSIAALTLLAFTGLSFAQDQQQQNYPYTIDPESVPDSLRRKLPPFSPPPSSS